MISRVVTGAYVSAFHLKINLFFNFFFLVFDLIILKIIYVKKLLLFFAKIEKLISLKKIILQYMRDKLYLVKVILLIKGC